MTEELLEEVEEVDNAGTEYALMEYKIEMHAEAEVKTMNEEEVVNDDETPEMEEDDDHNNEGIDVDYEEEEGEEEEDDDREASTDIVGRSIINEDGVRVRRYFCPVCDKSYARTDKLRIHLRNIHNVSSPAKKSAGSGGLGQSKSDTTTCNWCGKMFSDVRKLDRHLMTHDPTPFSCSLCVSAFGSRAELQAHRTQEHRPQEHDQHSSLGDTERPFLCRACDKSFGRLEQLRKHLAVHPDLVASDALAEYDSEQAKARFPCTTCGKSYTRVEKLDLHMFTHDETPFHCDQCDQGFASRREMRQHYDECTTDMKLLPCPRCDKLCTSKRLLSLHMDEHEELELACPVCGKTFSTRLLLSQHHRTKHEKAFQCSVCGKQLSRQDKLDSHMKQHNGYPCGGCGETYATRRELRDHDLVAHNSEGGEGIGIGSGGRLPKPKPYRCCYCPLSYTTQAKLDAHLQDGHDANGYTCEQCGKPFESKAKLKAHTYKHNAKLCGICGVWISNSFSAHMRRHEGLKPFKCQVEGCEKTFLRNCDLTSHTKTHTGEKRFACDFPNCNMRFSRPYKVAVHKRTHTGEKPYKCEFENCQREFSQSFDLTLHVRRHTGEKPYECEGCKESFILTSILKKHQQSCDKIRVTVVEQIVKVGEETMKMEVVVDCG